MRRILHSEKPQIVFASERCNHVSLVGRQIHIRIFFTLVSVLGANLGRRDCVSSGLSSAREVRGEEALGFLGAEGGLRFVIKVK